MDWASVFLIAAMGWFILYCLPLLGDNVKTKKKSKRHHQHWHDEGEVSECDRVLLETIEMLTFKLSDTGRKQFYKRFGDRD